MLAFQRELSTTIAQQIRLRLSPERLDALARRQAHNPEAYDAYLQGRYYWNLFTPATTRKAVECYLRATQLDPNYALAWSGLADAYTSSPIHADVRPRDVWEKARRAAEQAIAVEPELAETQTSWGFVKFWLDWDWTEAEAAYRRAIAIDPNYSLVYRLLGIVLGHIGHREEEARQAMERARAHRSAASDASRAVGTGGISRTRSHGGTRICAAVRSGADGLLDCKSADGASVRATGRV